MNCVQWRKLVSLRALQTGHYYKRSENQAKRKVLSNIRICETGKNQEKLKREKLGVQQEGTKTNNLFSRSILFLKMKSRKVIKKIPRNRKLIYRYKLEKTQKQKTRNKHFIIQDEVNIDKNSSFNNIHWTSVLRQRWCRGLRTSLLSSKYCTVVKLSTTVQTVRPVTVLTRLVRNRLAPLTCK